MFDASEFLANVCDEQEKTIGRRIKSTDVLYAHYNADGTHTEQNISLFGNFTQARAQRYLRRAYHTQNIIVLGVMHTSKYFAMSLNDFIKNATIIND